MSSVARLLERRKLHVQLELLTNMLKNLIRDLLPPVILIVLLVAVVLNVLLAKANGIQSQLKDRYPLVVAILVAWSTLFTLQGFLFLRFTASLRVDSLEQSCQTGGPRAKSGPRRFQNWPARDSQILAIQGYSQITSKCMQIFHQNRPISMKKSRILRDSCAQVLIIPDIDAPCSRAC